MEQLDHSSSTEESRGSIGLVTQGVAKVLGSAGLSSTVGALRAHLTRAERAIEKAQASGSGASTEDLRELTNKRDSLRARIDALLGMTAPALPAPSKS